MDRHDLLIYSAPLFLLAIGIEYWLSRKLGIPLYTKNDFLTNVGFAVGNIIAGSLATSFYLVLYYTCFHFFESYREAFLHYSSLGWGWKIWLLCLLADDFTYYWYHRCSHTIRILWASHIIHHSSEHYNFSTAIRNGWFAFAYKHLFWLWMAIIGFHPLMILACLTINTGYAFFCHTRFLPWWDKFSGILVTPGIHAIHHGLDDRSIDKNFAAVFILYDRLFGTYEPISPSQKVNYGVTKPPRSNHYGEVMIHEYRDLFIAIKNSRSWKVRLLYLFKKPGWSPGNVEK